jgi:hypothetical protein
VARNSSHPAGRRHGVTGRHAPRSAAAFHQRPPRGHLRWSLLRALPGLDTRQTTPWDLGGSTHAGPTCGWCPPYVPEAAKIKSPNLCRGEDNKMSRDVNGLFLGVRFMLSRVIVMSWLGCSSRTSCLSRRGVLLEIANQESG